MPVSFEFCGGLAPFLLPSFCSDLVAMRMVTGALLLLAAEQAFAHAYLISFPYQAFASEVLVPASGVLGVLGLAFLIWGLVKDGRK